MKTRNVFIAKVLIILIIIYNLSGCTRKSNLEIFFKEAEKELPDKQKSALKNCKGIGDLKIIAPHVDSGFASHFITPPGYINKMLDSLGIVKDRPFILFIAFHRELNNKNYSLSDIKREYQFWNDSIESEVINWEKQFYGKLSDIAKENFDIFSIGDTLCLELSLDKNKYVVYESVYNKKNFEDTLFVKCILLDKKNDVKENNNSWHDEIRFQVRVLSLSEPACVYIGVETQIGDTINIPVFDYGRIIKQSCDNML